MKQIQTITITELTAMADQIYGNFTKAVADVTKSLIVIDAEMHVDAEQYARTWLCCLRPLGF